MRRRPGIAGLQNAAATRDQFRLVGENVAKVRTDVMKEQLATFRTQLEEFARKHKNDIRKNPLFRQQFHEMCAKVGVDPLASNKGAWAELLGIGDFYYELGVQIVDICIATRATNGGLIDLLDLRKLLCQKRKADLGSLTSDDCLRAISKLKASILRNSTATFFWESCNCIHASFTRLHSNLWPIKFYLMYLDRSLILLVLCL
ncbi:Os09g0529700 [Oryza sativa Japonica Group]|uniref:Os09g0529700 protein n=1 Tax=Oryza sativa subsp. japonica TaxID=39947 RepID=C7J6S8_ORYSJ|nr:Os09g0529700 [Oryza sativa Japonica Group]|eukprot:NP_001175952.1 Os09g0529700 [Oryza sativa Japonica Group]